MYITPFIISNYESGLKGKQAINKLFSVDNDMHNKKIFNDLVYIFILRKIAGNTGSFNE